MAGLILFMARPGVIYIRQAIERERAIAFESRRLINELPRPVQPSKVLIPRPAPSRIGESAPAAYKLQPCVEQPRPQSIMESLMKIPHLPQLFPDPTRFQLFLIRAQRVCRCVACRECLVYRLRCEHSAFDRRVDPFQPL